MPFPLAHQLLEEARIAGAFPAAAIEVGRADGPIWAEAFGALTREPDARPADERTVFDLASLTKVIATSSLVARHVRAGGLTFETPLSAVLTGWTDDGPHPIQVRHLLDHSSGLAAHARIWEQAHGREDYVRAIAALPRERRPGEASVYSDPGFILLGFALEDVAGQSLDAQFARLAEELELGEIGYRPPASWLARTAPTELDPWRGRMLVGEVHDENAAALGGVAGHAGLFGTAAAVGTFARVVLRSFHVSTPLATPDLMRRMAAPTGVTGSSRALGWDTMLPTSSCGTQMSPSAIGHTGFTGTSLWIDWERDLYVVLLTNRVHPTRANDRLVSVRPQVHDAIMTGLGKVRSTKYEVRSTE